MEKQTTEIELKNSDFATFSAAEQAVLKAIRCPQNGIGVIRALDTACEALSAYSASAKLERVDAWLDVANGLSEKLTLLQESNPSLGMTGEDENLPVFSLLASPPVSKLTYTEETRCHQILGRLVASAISNNDALKVNTINAWATLRRGRKSGNAVSDWSKFITQYPTTTEEINAAHTWVKSINLRELLDDLLVANSTPILSPQIHDDGRQEASEEAHSRNSKLQANNQDSAPKNALDPDDFEDPDYPENEEPSSQKSEDNEDKKHFKDSLAGLKIKQANFARYTQKFGLIGDRNRLHPKSVKDICRKLNVDLRVGSEQTRVYATLAYMCLKLGFPSAKAIGVPILKTKPGSFTTFPHIDVAQRQIVWNYRHFIESADSQELLLPRSNVELIPIAFDGYVGNYLASLQTLLSSNATNLGELLGVPSNKDERKRWLKNYRRYLRQKGDLVHPAYDARFASAGSDVYRFVCKSEIKAVFLAQDFTSCPIGPLHYTTLPAKDLIEANEQWESYLGFQPAKAIPDSEIKGAIINASAQEAATGWNAAQADIASHLEVMRESQAFNEVLSSFNQIAVSRLCSVIFLTGHRGTHLSKLSMRSLYSHPDIIHIYDKDVGSYQSNRLIPCHKYVDQVLSAWQTDIEILLARANQLGVSIQAIGRRSIKHSNPDRSAFFNVRLGEVNGNWVLQRSVLTTKSVYEYSEKHFRKPINIGRHFIVSGLLSIGLSVVFVLLLTGHARLFSEVFADPMGTAPAYLLAELKKHVTELLDRLQLNPVAGYSGIERSLLTLSGTVPDHANDIYLHPHMDGFWRVLPQVCDGFSTSSTETTEQVRKLMMKGLVADDLAADLLMCSAVFDGLSLSDIQIVIKNFPDSVCDIQETKCWVWRRDGHTNEIILPISPRTLLPLVAIGAKSEIEFHNTRSLVATWLKKAFPKILWEGSSEDIFAAFMAIVGRWIRYQISPRSLTAKSEAVPTTTPSRRSLLRLEKGADTSQSNAPLPRAIRLGSKKSRIDISEIFQLIREPIYEASKTRMRSGEELQRSKMVQAEIDAISDQGDMRVVRFKEVLKGEIELWKSDQKKADQFSTLNNYFTEVACALELLSPLDDMSSWTSGEFMEWAQKAKRAIDAANPEKASVKSNATRFFGLKRFIVIGKRLGWEIPGGLFSEEKQDDIFNRARKSAASTLFFKSDREGIEKQLNGYFSDSTEIRDLALLANRLDDEAPLRHRERDVLRKACIIPTTNQLSIQTDGFSHLKSVHAVRLIGIPDELVSQISTVACKSTDVHSRFLFLPDDAMDWSTLSLIDECLVSAMVRVTGEASVRQHSKRASAVCRRIDPDWEDVARALFSNSWSTEMHVKTLRSLHARGHSNFIMATRETGHGHSLVTSVYYYSVWVFHFASEMQASLQNLKPSTKLFNDTLGGNDNLRKIRQIYKKKGLVRDHWNEVVRHCRNLGGFKSLLPIDPDPVFADRFEEVVDQADVDVGSISLLALLLLGARRENYSGDFGFPDSYAKALDAILPPDSERKDILRRRRGEATPDALLRDREFVVSQVGRSIATSLASADKDLLSALHDDLDLDRTAVKVLRLGAVQMIKRIQSHLKLLPGDLKLHIRTSTKHPNLLSPSMLQEIGDRLIVDGQSPRLGAHPAFQVAPAKQSVGTEEKGRASVCLRALVLAAILYRNFIKEEEV